MHVDNFIEFQYREIETLENNKYIEVYKNIQHPDLNEMLI